MYRETVSIMTDALLRAAISAFDFGGCASGSWKNTSAGCGVLEYGWVNMPGAMRNTLVVALAIIGIAPAAVRIEPMLKYWHR